MDNVPRHIAIIMDGNGRWAKERNLPRTAGHRRGADSAKEAVKTCMELGVKALTLFAFSTENWKRPKREVSVLMGLLKRFLDREADDLKKNNIRLGVIGRTERLQNEMRSSLARALSLTKDCDGFLLTLALDYGSREEITQACRLIAKDISSKKLRVDEVDEVLLSGYLYTKEMPDLDLLIRTSGEMRLSNFLLWQASYAELYFSKKCWPDFRAEDLKEAVGEYARRERRFGG